MGNGYGLGFEAIGNGFVLGMVWGLALAIILAWWYWVWRFICMDIWGYAKGISNANGLSMVNGLCII